MFYYVLSCILIYIHVSFWCETHMYSWDKPNLVYGKKKPNSFCMWIAYTLIIGWRKIISCCMNTCVFHIKMRHGCKSICKTDDFAKELLNAYSEIKWDTIYEKKFNWISIWYILNKIKCKHSIIQFQLKCLHNIVYSEYRLQKMGKKFIKSRSSVISPSYTPMNKFSSTSTIFFSKMLLKMCLIWYILNKIKCKQSIIQFQWKCLNNIVYQWFYYYDF
jgi:hypothetical protein